MGKNPIHGKEILAEKGSQRPEETLILAQARRNQKDRFAVLFQSLNVMKPQVIFDKKRKLRFQDFDKFLRPTSPIQWNVSNEVNVSLRFFYNMVKTGWAEKANQNTQIRSF
ncbi:hypothetical protein GCM10009119_14580 [Algoriphagus jejuensis]|uniref:Integrase-like protein n=1 Tax=Algoriphagus jejuensis TaxID=419934 RepID=A0ABN1MYM3_9BACT